MGGGMAQIASFGVADQYLTGNPQVTMFKAVYRRHTNFAMESVEQTFDGSADFGRKASCTISKNGDLAGAVWLEVTLPDLLAHDIFPAPPDGNTVDVTTLDLHVDPLGNHWQTKVGTTYTDPVAFFDGSRRFAYAAVGGEAVTGYDAVAGTYLTAAGSGAAVEREGEWTTWPYLIRDGPPGGPATFAAPTHAIRWTNSIGHAILKSVEIEIGGTRIDKHYGEWYDVWSELSEPEEKREGLWRMIGKYADADYDAGWRREQSAARTYYVPLRFCFNSHPGLYLPLIAFMFHQIKYNFEFREYLECVKAAVPVYELREKAGGDVIRMTACRIFSDFVYLDSLERTRLAEVPHEYLITQLQFTGDESVPAPSDPNGTRSRKYALNYNHPVRELVWVYVAKSNHERNAVTGNNWFRYDVPGDPDAEVFDEARLVLNGADRFAARSAPYFRLVQPYEHHTRCPAKRVHCYSFSLQNPEDHQPSGQANFSRFDTAHLQFLLNKDLPAGRMKIFATNFNVLRVQQGMAGLAFASV